MGYEIERRDDDTMVLNMGPSHPAMHGTIRMVVRLAGETIEDANVEIGFLHRGFEKMAESFKYQQVIPLTDRLNYVSPIINNVGYVMAVEKLLGIVDKLPERNQYIRVIMSEISRVVDHLTCLGAMVMEVGAQTAFFYFMTAREFLYQVIEHVTGARVTTSYTRIGGLRSDLPENFEAMTEEALQKTEEVLEEIHGLFDRNRIFIDRTRNVGVISPEDAISYGFTGPLLRATGVPYDVRKAHPYLVYDKMDFEIPVGDNGDNFDRYIVRMLEMEQSIKIIRQAIRELPEGPINIDSSDVVLPAKEDVYNSIEGTIKHFKLIFEGIKPPKGEAYFSVEGGNGELGFYVVSDGTENPLKVRVRPPSFVHMAAVKDLIVGHMLPDIIPVFGSINMIGGECDR